MTPLIPIAAGIMLGAAWLYRPKTGPARGSPSIPILHGGLAKDAIATLTANTGASERWQAFFLAVAAGESNFESDAVNKSPGEQAAARRGYERALDTGWISSCNLPSSDWTWGSGGWLGLLPTSAWRCYAGTNLLCRSPRVWLLNPVDTIVTALGYAERIAHRSAFKSQPTYLQMRVGWRNPSLIGDPDATASVRATMSHRLEQLGISLDLLDQPIDPIPAANGSSAADLRKLIA